MGSRVETALALAVLYGLDGKNECRVVSISSSRTSLLSAAYCEVVGRFYAGAVSAAFGAFARTLPVGLAADGKIPGDTPLLTGPLNRTNPDGSKTYQHGIERLIDTAEAYGLIRNAFTAQHDENAAVVLAGPPNNLLKTLTLPGAKELIAAKVKVLVCSTALAAKELEAAGWPTPIVAVGQSSILFPLSTLEKEFSAFPAHPVADALKAYGKDAPTGELSAVLYAVRPTDKAFTLSEPVGKIRQLMIEPAEKERLLASYIELATAKPVVRQPRFRRPVVEEPKKPETAPAKP
jgi:intracellular sulfur oxidation DsrE/DsrF family protein